MNGETVSFEQAYAQTGSPTLEQIRLRAAQLCDRQWIREIESDPTKSRITDAALPHLLSSYQGTTMQLIAGIIGIKAPSLYNHFKSKQDILLAAVEQNQVNCFRSVLLSDSLAETISPAERLRAFTRLFVEWQLANPVSADLTFFLQRKSKTGVEWPANDRTREMFERRRLLVQYVRALVSDLVHDSGDSGSVRALAFGVLQLCFSSVDYPSGDGGDAEAVAQVTQLVNRLVRV